MVAIKKVCIVANSVLSIESAKNNLSGRIGEIKENVNAVMFLLSEQADYINGENLNVNGVILLK